MANTRIGSLWLKEKDGKKYFSGVLNDLKEDINVVVFKNDHKEEGSNQPDYVILRSAPREERPSPSDVDL